MASPDDYMPSGEWYQLYETVSLGTPLSPPFATPEELINWLVNNTDFYGDQWTLEQATKILKFGGSPSMFTQNGKIYAGNEALDFMG